MAAEQERAAPDGEVQAGGDGEQVCCVCSVCLGVHMRLALCVAQSSGWGPASGRRRRRGGGRRQPPLFAVWRRSRRILARAHYFQVITPWDVAGGADGKVDYNKLVVQFGVSLLTEDLVARCVFELCGARCWCRFAFSTRCAFWS